ncbi:MAG: hypothetical protein P1P88_17990 [Bacteroidales bacterium]|nr:hypothetical protein [Bacteroidales bacterium]
MKFKILITFAVAASLIFSCSGGSDTDQEQDSIIDLNSLDTGVIITDGSTEIIYLVSTPGEIVEVLNESNLGFKVGLIHDFTESENYLVQSSQAINLGIYSADLAYCAYYDELNSSANLFVAVQDLCKKLEVSYLLESIQLNRVKNNLHSPDSIKRLSKEYNKKIYDHFLENKKENLLSLISLGGFIESLYLATNNIENFEPDSEISRLLAEQKYTFEVIRDYIVQQKGDDQISFVLDDIKKLDSFFAEVKPTSDEKTTVKNNNGKIVIGGKNNLLLTKTQYKKLKETIDGIRSKYCNL